MKGQANSRSGTPDSIRESLKKAVTELLVLLVLRKRPMYNYEIMQEIDKLSDGSIVFNTLYQAIYRLQGFHYITERGKELVDNRVRIFFAITPEGEIYLDRLIAEYRSFTMTISRILETSNDWKEEKGNNNTDGRN